MSGREGRRRVEPSLAVVSSIVSFSVHRYFQERLYMPRSVRIWQVRCWGIDIIWYLSRSDIERA